MKRNIHPELHEIVARCACGSTYPTSSTESDIKVTICAGCHPFYTGEQRHMDTAGRIEKFQKRFDKFQKANAKNAK